MPHLKLIARLTAVAGLSAQDSDKLGVIPHTIHLLEHGEYLLRLGDHPFSSSIVISGVIARQKTVRDRNQISSFYLPGDMPDLQTLQIPIADHDFCSIGDTAIASIPHAYLRELMHGSSELTEVFWRESLLQGALYCEWVNNLGSRPALERIAHLLCELASRLEIVGLCQNRAAFEVPFRQLDIAEALGLSTVHVNRSLQELRRRGLIEWEGHAVRLLQRQRLEQICEFTTEYLYARRAVPPAHNVVGIGRTRPQ
jgi:CRP-like cAMP-binding protein